MYWQTVDGLLYINSELFKFGTEKNQTYLENLEEFENFT